MELSKKVGEMLGNQLNDWDLASKNYNDLKKIKTKNLILTGGSVIKVQFNPERIRSSAAKIDKETISERPCFLCKKNRPIEQKSITFNKKYSILVNPFPIFPEHLTIVYNDHIDQLITPHFEEMLNLAKELQDFTIFYNGPKSGASAPDHFHFQAGIKGFMGIEKDFQYKKFTTLYGGKDGVFIFTWENYHRHIITLESASKIEMIKVFNQLQRFHNNGFQPDEPEMMLNILCYYENQKYITHIFPRILHRPDCYFAKGDEQILISPASVDMGGLFVLAREEDFDKISAKDIENILQQVCLPNNASDKIIDAVLKE